jgi:GT2 family glycosyltransferase
MKAEIFVLNYNGRDLLLECLPSILEAAKRSPHPCRVTVIDNCSADDSVGVLRRAFPEAAVLVPERNLVLCSFNEAVKKSDADVVLLLNNDLKVEKDFVAPLLEVFEKHADAFLAGPHATTFDGARYEGCLSKMSFTRGILRTESRFAGYEAKVRTAGLTMQAGFGAYRREAFLALGGFDPLYLPGTVEDSDLCFRAWKAGYSCYYVPASRVYHKGQATFKKHFGAARLLAMNQRNLYLFTWKNISDPRLLIQHLGWLPVRPLYFLLRGRIEFLWGFLWAMLRLPAAIARRFSAAGPARRTDREIFGLSEAI